MAGSGQTPLGQWITNNLTPAGKISNAMSGGKTPNAATDLRLTGSETPEQIAERKKKLMSAGQSESGLARFGSAAMALLGSHL